MDIKIAQQMTITELVLENQKLKLDAQREAEHHDRMVGELEKVYAERDEARDTNKKLREVLEWIAERYDDSKPMHQVAMDAYEMSCAARAILQKEETK